MLCFSVNYAIEIIQKIIMKILQDGFLSTKIVTHVLLAMKSLTLSIYSFGKFFIWVSLKKTLINYRGTTWDDFAKFSSGIKWNICATLWKVGQSICMPYRKYWAQYGFNLVNLVRGTLQANVILGYKYR